MKHFLLFFLLIPVAALSQDCQLKKTTDEFTRETKLSTGFFPLQNASLSVDADKKEIDFFFSLDGANKCFDNTSDMIIFYQGTRQKNSFKNSGTMNCEGLFHFTVRNGHQTPYVLQRLSTLKVDSIKFTGNNKITTVIRPTPEQQETILQTAACVAKEAQTLLQ
jgi:hypothetical protein